MLNFTDIFWTRSIQIPDQFYHHHHLHVDLSSHHLHHLYNMKCLKYKPPRALPMFMNHLSNQYQHYKNRKPLLSITWRIGQETIDVGFLACASR